MDSDCDGAAPVSADAVEISNEPVPEEVPGESSVVASLKTGVVSSTSLLLRLPSGMAASTGSVDNGSKSSVGGELNSKGSDAGITGASAVVVPKPTLAI